MLVTKDGRRLYVEHRRNQKEHTILIIHGGPGESCITFGRLAEELAPYADVVLVDQRGVLRSGREPDPSKINVRQVVLDFEDIRRQLGMESWAVLGHSFGGRVALSYAAWFPRQVEAVVLENPAIDIRTSLQSLLGSYRKLYEEMPGRCADLEGQKQALEEAARSGDMHKQLAYLAQIPARYRCICFGNNILDQDSQALFQYPGFGPGDIKKCRDVSAAFLQDPGLEQEGARILEGVSCPILLLRDAKDPMLPEEEARLIRERGKEIRMEGGSHYLHLKEPGKVSEWIGGFLHGNGTGKNHPAGNP